MNQSVGFFYSILPKAMIFALLSLVLFQPDAVIAKIYKYQDENGKTHFTDDASNVPMQYRNKDSLKAIREVNEPTPEQDAPSEAAEKEDKSKDEKDEGLSPKDAGLIRRSIQVLKAGVALGDQFKNAMPTFSNGIGAVTAIQSGLPVKEGLAAELEGTKVPALQGVVGFLKQSIAADKEILSVGTGLKRRIAGIFSRLATEGGQQSSMIDGLEKALKDAGKQKTEVKKQKQEEAHKQ